MSLLLLALSACTKPAADDTGGVTPREFSDCDPISYDYCSLPYPSSFYLRTDDTSATGFRVQLGATTLPMTHQGYQPPPDLWNELDGFSPMGPILARFPNLALTGVPGHDDIGASIADGAPIVLVDMETGERMPYFAELDMAGVHVAGREFLFIRPVVPLRNGHRYAVGVRNLVDTSGAAIAASEGYAALRDGTATDNWDIEGRRDTFEEVFTTLEADGWARSETILAWDFVVGSKEKITGRAEWMRDDTLARIGAGPAYVIDSVTDEVSDTIYREIQGHFTAPLYLEADEPDTLLTRDENGMPFYNGDTTVRFTIRVPRTAVENPRPLKLVQYGHGLLGDQGEVGAGYLGEMANKYGYVLFATNWRGMAEDDLDAITLMLVSDIGRFGIIPEGGHQGLIEFVAAAAMMQGSMASDASLAFASPETGSMVSVIDPSEVYYYGNSQGGILGGVYLAMSPTIERGVLGVPGMPYSLLLSRSSDFTPFFALFQGIYRDQEHISFWMALLQNLWDSAEPGGWGRQMIEDPIAGVPQKQVLLQDAIGDAQVSTLGAQNMARAYGASLIETPLAEVWGVDIQPSGFTGSALVEYEHGAPEVPFTNTPPDEDEDTHEDTRRALAAQEQLNTFLTTGVVQQYCDGVCDPD
ncbi:MAG: hypothetical protein Q8P18_25060 [Pseudomonadota bacterium]|nr:hypothetical protein [Pseudomonadota bacterium]